jgi:hypothetical protein
VLTCRVVDTKRVDAKRRASGGAEQVVADVSDLQYITGQNWTRQETRHAYLGAGPGTLRLK